MRHPRFILSLVACLLTLASSGSPCVADEAWHAGVASVSITPSEFMWMSGYGSRDKPADGKISDLYAKALVLRDPAGHQLVLITADLVGVGRSVSQEICAQLQQKHGLTRSQIAIATSHTHSGPVVGSNLMAMFALDERQAKLVEDYREQLIRKIVRVTQAAMEDVKPAVLQTGEGHATFAVNRRNNRESDVPALRDAGQLVGPVDHSLPVLAVRSPEGQLRSIVFGYACHATVLSGMQWCGDWPGFAQAELEQRHPECIAMFWAGCGADQNPLPRRTVELAQDYGLQTAESVQRTLKGPMKPVSGSLKSDYREVNLAFHEIPSKETIEADLVSADIFIARRAQWLLKQLARDGELSKTYPYPIQMWKLGDDVTMTILGGEVVVDLSLRLKDELPGNAQWIAGYCNDVMAYIPSRRVLLEGGYEGEKAMIYYGLPSRWSDNVEEHIIDTVKDMNNQLSLLQSASE